MGKSKFSLDELVIYEDNDLIVFNKPAGLTTLDRRDMPAADSVISLARQKAPEASPCHRLDKETSGAVVVAKHPQAYRHVSLQFQNREVLKTYHALVAGVHQLDGIEISVPIKPLANGLARLDTTEGKPAKTVFFTLKNYKKHTLIECYPITGRMHQIRLHLMYLKAKIVGDSNYGSYDLYLSQIKPNNFNLKNNTQEKPLIGRVALHAFSITFADMQNQRHTVEAPYPKDIRAVLKQLDKFDALR